MTAEMIKSFMQKDAVAIRNVYGERLSVAECEYVNNPVNRVDYVYIRMFDYDGFLDFTGKERYERKIKKDKSPMRAPARE